MHVVVKGFVTNMPEVMSASGGWLAGWLAVWLSGWLGWC
jgi:hypothetical protein